MLSISPVNIIASTSLTPRELCACILCGMREEVVEEMKEIELRVEKKIIESH